MDFVDGLMAAFDKQSQWCCGKKHKTKTNYWLTVTTLITCFSILSICFVLPEIKWRCSQLFIQYSSVLQRQGGGKEGVTCFF